VPARRERAGLGLAVADHAGHDQVRIVERRAVGVRERIAELAALVDRAGRLGSHVARDPAREAELLEQAPHALLVLADARIHLAVGAFEVGVRDGGRPAVPGPDHVDHVEVVLLDHAVQVRVEEVQARRGAPVPEQARLHVLARERLAQQRVVEQVDLPDGEVVRGAPERVELAELRLR
jgi:hypothetical protein